VSFSGAIVLESDPDMFRQVVANLLKNAVQYGGDDPIEVSGTIDSGKVILQVKNGGTPISADERANIFDRFFRGRASRSTDGFGLGLALVKEACTVLGAQISLLDVPGRTVFQVTLPAAS
jgi:signal transduction histidine kinase